MAVTIKDNRARYEAVRRNLFEHEVQVLVGITEHTGRQLHGGDRGVVSGTTLLEIAIWNEFGTKHIPERSFLRSWFDKETNKIRVQKWVVALMPSLLNGRKTKEQILNQIGLKIVGEIQKNIVARIPPPNAPVTIEEKGSDVPLVNTGVLRSSIQHVVRRGGAPQ